MERILVSMDAHHGAWEAWSRTVSLAKRMETRVYVLLVLPPAGPLSNWSPEREVPSVRRRLELLIELAKAEGIPVDYFISEGEYEEEVIRFVSHNKITLLVAEAADGESRVVERGALPIRKILHRIACRVEIVSPRSAQQVCKHRGH